MKIDYKKLIICILIPLMVGTVARYLTQDGMEQFFELKHPPLTPPEWMFPVVWTILYIFMGIALYIILAKEGKNKTNARMIFYCKLVVNLLWSIIFFNLQWHLFAFFWLLMLWVMIIIMLKEFYEISKWAAYLNIPYLLWVTFAGYLNFGIWWLNG